jgi:dUTP pyrophosphatase
MKIKVIDFGYKNLPLRAHENDAGADVYACGEGSCWIIAPHETVKIPLGFGLEVPDGYMACVYPRSGLSAKGIVCELPPIDSGYRGEVHAIVSNLSNESFMVNDGDRIGQLVVTPVVIAEYVTEKGKQRGTGAFGSTGVA